MKSYKKELTELPEDCVQKLIAEPIDKDEQIEQIITFNDFSQEEIVNLGMNLAESKISAEDLSKLLQERTFQIESE